MQVKQKFEDFYYRFDNIFTSHEGETKKLLTSINTEMNRIDKKLVQLEEENKSSLKHEKNDPDTETYKIHVQLKKRLVTKLMEQIENKDEVLNAIKMTSNYASLRKALEAYGLKPSKTMK